MAKPIKSLELHFPMIQFLIYIVVRCVWKLTEEWINVRWSTKQNCSKIHMYSHWVDYMLIYIYNYNLYIIYNLYFIL